LSEVQTRQRIVVQPNFIEYVHYKSKYYYKIRPIFSHVKKKKKNFTIASFLLLCVLSITIVINSINMDAKLSTFPFAFAHNFPPNNYAKLIAFMDQFQIESNLVKGNLINNDTTLAQKHANEANSIFYWDLLVEIVKQDKEVGDELKISIGDLRNLTSSFSNNTYTTVLEKQQALQRVDQITKNINTNIEKIITNTASLEQSKDANFLNMMTGFFSNLINGGQDAKNSNDGSIHPIRFAELLDSVLRNYGDAYAVSFDMTDMTNMAMTNDSSSKMNHSMMNMSNSHVPDEGNIEPIKNMANYQSATGSANKLLDLFNQELKPIITSKNDTSNLSNNLENGIVHLINSIKERAAPMEIMTIVHSQIHPSLVEAFDLQILSTS